jgi:protein phosphatase
MAVFCAVLTDVGRKREANEDYFSTVEASRLYLVADGLGGHAAGRLAAEAGTSEIVRRLASQKLEPGFERLRGAFRAANARIRQYAEGDAALRGMGTTLAALWLDTERGFLAHIGDSRIYLLRGGRIHPLTLDHSVVGEMISRRELRPEHAHGHPSRNVITRALGVRAVVEPDLAWLRLVSDDRFVLCTDGLTTHVRDEEIAAVCLDCAEGSDPGGDLEQAAEVLIELTNARGGEDNTTVALVHYTGQESEGPKT